MFPHIKPILLLILHNYIASAIPFSTPLSDLCIRCYMYGVYMISRNFQFCTSPSHRRPCPLLHLLDFLSQYPSFTLFHLPLQIFFSALFKMAPAACPPPSRDTLPLRAGFPFILDTSSTTAYFNFFCYQSFFSIKSPS